MERLIYISKGADVTNNFFVAESQWKLPELGLGIVTMNDDLNYFFGVIPETMDSLNSYNQMSAFFRVYRKHTTKQLEYVYHVVPPLIGFGENFCKFTDKMQTAAIHTVIDNLFIVFNNELFGGLEREFHFEDDTLIELTNARINERISQVSPRFRLIQNKKKTN